MRFLSTLGAVILAVESWFCGTTGAKIEYAQNVSTNNCQDACKYLSKLPEGKVYYQGTPAYDFGESRYWSQQQASVTPFCRLNATSAGDVSAAIIAARLFNCPFAVKSGGHAAFAGGSNIQGGITIDLAGLNEVTVSADKKTTRVGAGNVWANVYSQLDPLGLSVIGGRVSDIGVGGLTLGGGISYFSGRYGMACDNVNNYEVVLANGTIRDINYSSYPDLYWALRGGGNNFGIVTRFDLATFPQGPMWGASKFYSIDKAPSLFTSLADFAVNAPSDPDAAMILGVAYLQSQQKYVVVVNYEYAKPQADPPVFDEFKGIESVLTLYSKVTSLTDLTVTLNASNPGGFRQTYWTATFDNNATLMTNILSIFEEEINPITDVAGLLPSCVYNPFTTSMISQGSKNGGNALGVAGGPYTILNIAISWSTAADDARVMQAARNIVNRSVKHAKDLGLSNRFLYQNYAAREQDVFGSYGTNNRNRLLKVRQKYDPDEVFTKLQPGYFKLLMS